MNARAILAIARKDVIDAVRNLYVLFAIVLPLGVWALAQVITPPSGGLKIGPVAVYDQGSSKLVAQLGALPTIQRLIPTRSLQELTEAVRKEAVGGLILPADLDLAAAEGRTSEVTVLINGRRGGGELTAFRRMVDEQVQGLAARPPVAQLVERDVNAPATAAEGTAFSFRRFTLVLLLTMGLAMTGTFVVPTLLVEEKEKGTLKAILVSPASHADVVAGKALVGLFYALLMAVIVLALNNGLQGDLALLALALVLGTLFVVEAGLLMGAAFNTAAQVNTWSSLVMIVLIAPTFAAGVTLPDTVEAGLRILPTHYLSQLILASSGASSENVWASILVLLGSVAALFAAIVWSLRRAER